MKRIIRNLCLTILLSGAAIAPIHAGAPEHEVTIDREHFNNLDARSQERVLAIAARMEQIMAIDRSQLDRDQRRALRSELRGLKDEARTYAAAGGGTVIYISGVGLLLIIILLIVLL